jgi:hypothetical protein
LQKSFSNQNSRQRSLASNTSNNVYRKRPFSGLHKKNSPFQDYTNISKSNKSCCQFSIFAWNSGCWSFSANYLSDLCLDLSRKTCFNFDC